MPDQIDPTNDDLSPEEVIAAKELAENERADVDTDIAKALAAEGEPAAKADGDEAAAAEGADDAKAEPAAAAATAEPAKAAPEPIDGRPTPVQALTAEEQAKLDGVAAERKALIKQFNDGDLGEDEFDGKLADLIKGQTELVAKQQAAAAAVENDTATWDEVCADWLKGQPEFGKLPPEGFGAFNAIVQSFTASDLSNGLSYRQMLDEARLMFERRFPNVLPKPEAKPEPKAEPGKRPDRELPPTLARMPATDLSDANDGQHAALDKVDDADYESALEDLATRSPAQLEQYLRSA